MSDDRHLADQLERHARAQGAQHAELLLTRTRRKRAESGRRGVSGGDEQALLVRVAVDGKVGVARGVDLGEAAGRTTIEAAVRDARLSTAEPAAPPPPRLDVSGRGLGILDHRYPQVDDAARREVVSDNVEGCRGVDSDLELGSFVYEEMHQRRVAYSTGGRAVAEESTRYRLVGEAWHKARPGEKLVEINTSRNFADVASRPLGVTLGRRALRQAEPHPLPDDPTAVILAQRVVATLLPRLVRSLRAERVGQQISFLGRNAGDRIASPALHVVDDARMAGGYASRAFDDRGVPSVSITLLKEGVLQGAYQGVESAHATDTRPSGHETFDGELWIGNLIVRPGNRSRNMLFPDLGTFVEIEDLDGPVVFDEVTGLLELRGRVWVKDTDRDHGYAGTRTLKCPVQDLLNSITHVCSDHERHGVVDTPTWICDGPWFVQG